MMNEKLMSMDEIVFIIHPLAEKYRIQAVYLFGSYARNNATKDSDLDFLVYGGPNFKPTSIFSFAEDVRKQTKKEVDAYEINEINRDSEFYQTIMKERVQIV